MPRQFYVYILTNRTNHVLYTGVTDDLVRRVTEHREKLVEGFTKRYRVDKLVYYEVCDDPYTAIVREKQIKAGSRADKERLVESMNREWTDLYRTL
ncbi:MAG: GIY-YIG nuclease family protein [Chloroflexi bacterium]|nr:GIY-YIG nuclease family protein [Chloroflexota bacterium]